MTFTIPDEIARRLAAAATALGVTVDEVLVEALTEWTAQHRAEPGDTSFINTGGDVASAARAGARAAATARTDAGGIAEAQRVARQRLISVSRAGSN